MTIVQAMLPRPEPRLGGLLSSHPTAAIAAAADIDEGQDGEPVHVGALRMNIRYDHFGAAPAGEQTAQVGALHYSTNSDNIETADGQSAAYQTQAVAANVVNTPAGAAAAQEDESLDAIAIVPISFAVADADPEVVGLLDRLKAAAASNGGAIAHRLASLAKSIEDGVIAIGEWIFKVRNARTSATAASSPRWL